MTKARQVHMHTSPYIQRQVAAQEGNPLRAITAPVSPVTAPVSAPVSSPVAAPVTPISSVSTVVSTV